MQEITSEKKRYFPRASCAALCREELASDLMSQKLKYFLPVICLVPCREELIHNCDFIVMKETS